MSQSLAHAIIQPTLHAGLLLPRTYTRAETRSIHPDAEARGPQHSLPRSDNRPANRPEPR